MANADTPTLVDENRELKRRVQILTERLESRSNANHRAEDEDPGASQHDNNSLPDTQPSATRENVIEELRQELRIVKQQVSSIYDGFFSTSLQFIFL